MIVTVFVTRLPSGFEGRSYDDRGWTFFERSSAELIKPATAYVVEEGRPLGEGRWLWAMIIDSSVADADEGRRPPLAPAAFEEQLHSKRFTNDADAGAVAALYASTATRVLGATRKIELDYVPVREGDGVRLAQALTLCRVVEELAWCFVPMPVPEVRAMLATPVPTLRTLYLQEAGLGEAGGVAVGEALGRGAVPQLQRMILDDNVLGERGAAALAAAIRAGAVPALATLDVERTGLGDEGKRALDEAASAMGGAIEIVYDVSEARCAE